MAADLNVWSATGRLTRDAELNTTGGGTDVLNFRLAFTTRAPSGDGSWDDKPNYIDVSLYGVRAKPISPYMKKGQQIAVEGRLEWREYTTRDDSKRQVIEVVANNITLVGGAPAQQDNAESTPPAEVGNDNDIPF